MVLDSIWRNWSIWQIINWKTEVSMDFYYAMTLGCATVSLNPKNFLLCPQVWLWVLTSLIFYFQCWV